MKQGTKTIDVSQVIRNLYGIPIMDSSAGVHMTLARAAVNAIEGGSAPMEPGDGMAKVQRRKLAERIYEAGAKGEPVTLDDAEIAIVKECIGYAYNAPVVVAEAWKMLDGETPQQPDSTTAH